jgi:hypothetical protein
MSCGRAKKAIPTSLLRPPYALLTISEYFLEVECHPTYSGALEGIDFRFYLQIATKRKHRILRLFSPATQLWGWYTGAHAFSPTDGRFSERSNSSASPDRGVF